MAREITAFSSGDDFISFDSNPAQAGPSRLKSTLPISEPSSNRGLPSPDPPSRGKSKANTKAELVENAPSSLYGTTHVDVEDTKNKKKKRKSKLADPPPKRAKSEHSSVGPRNLKEERKAAERAAPWADDIEWERYSDPAEMLNDEIHAFYRLMSPTRAEYEVRSYIIELITRTIQKNWPEAEVSPFGSWQTQLYLPTGDIDLVVTTDRFTEWNKSRMLHDLARSMRMAMITKTVAVIAKAKVPIIKFVTNEGNLNVDISLNQTNGVSAGKIVNHYLEAMPGARELILVVKAFLSQRSMNEVYTGGLGSYSVICMIVSFLQLHPKLRRSEIDPCSNLGTLLIEFFELYGRSFNYDDVGISIRRGGYYFSKRSRGWSNWNNQAFLLSIEDPQEPDNDISRSSFGIRQVKMTLAGAYDLLQAKLFERAEQLERYQSDRSKSKLDSQEMSILSGVMGVTKETMKHRRELKALYDGGRLQRKLGLPVVIDPDAHLPNTRSYRPDAPVTSPDRRKRSSPDGVQAIIVDDGDGDIDWDENNESGDENVLAWIDSDQTSDDSFATNRDHSSHYIVNFATLEDNHRPKGKNALPNHYVSVSEDDVSAGSDDDRILSRYHLARAKKRAQVDFSKEASPETDESSDDEDDDDAAAAATQVVRQKERQAFWAAKGGSASALEGELSDGEI